jgi:NAD(P) transhydrogenase
MTNHYDLVVIGGGPAGIVGAATAAGLGQTVALVDNHAELGGAGVNTGTVPSKTLRETALALSGMRSRNLYGVDLSLRREATVSDFLRHERNVQHGLNLLLAQRLAGSRADVYHGIAAFEDPHTIRIQTIPSSEPVRLSAGHVLIATGSSPVRPAMFPFDSPGVYDSDTILGLEHLPRAMAVVGSGVIGSEYACTFNALGTKVHLIDTHDVLLPFLDSEISRALATAMERSGVEFHWNQRVQSCTENPGDSIVLTFAAGGELIVDTVLIAAGRSSNTDTLNLAAAGVAASDKGVVTVDENFATNVAHIYAAGDVIGFPALASTSMHQARLAMSRAFGRTADFHQPHLVPTGVYTIPEIGCIGETEESLRKAGVDYVPGHCRYDANARGRIIGDVDGLLKLLFRREDMKLLGVHAIGEQATELVHIGMVAMLTNSTSTLFTDACFNVPTLGELYKAASLDAISRVQTGRSLADFAATAASHAAQGAAQE